MADSSEDKRIPSSPHRLQIEGSALLVVDVQENLVHAMSSGRELVFECGRLMEGADILGVPVIATEQYPVGLGRTVEPLTPWISDENKREKTTFSAASCSDLFLKLREMGCHRIVVCGIETHVCVLQTVLDLLADGWLVDVVVDGTMSRGELDHITALERLESSGATLTTVETVLFEWCDRSDRAEFKSISELVKRKSPGKIG